MYVLTCTGAHLEVELFFSEPKILGGDESPQEDIYPLAHRERHGDDAVGGWSSVQHTDIICEWREERGERTVKKGEEKGEKKVRKYNKERREYNKAGREYSEESERIQ